ncbi:MAG TPA: CxxC-x17-CxxC domain-containing protein [Patescibacteria group bacterium]|nr:CxxC-x17-CxxC domain-containing protein [Patescibacteria group bacterium]
MYRQHGHASGGNGRGFRKFGAKKSWGGGFDRDREGRAMYAAICAECGADCEVPFKPNGRKPVLCSNCFKKDGGDFERPAFRDTRPGFGPSHAQPSRDDGMRQINERLERIEMKLDEILTGTIVKN